MTVITSDGPGQAGVETRPNLEIHRLKIPFRVPHCLDATLPSLGVYALKACMCALSLARSRRPDLIHAFHVLPTGALAWLLSRFLGIRYAVTAIGAEIEDPVNRRGWLKHPLYRAWLRAVARRAAGVSAISAHLAKRVQGLDLPTPRVLPPGWKSLPLAASRAATSRPWTLVTTARLSPRKGLDLVLDAVARFPFKAWRLILIGDGPQRPALEQQARNLGLVAQVEFAGFVSEARKFALLQQAQVFVLPTLFEGFGIAYLEAMGCGLPVVATGEGGHRDFIVHEENGLWVESREPEVLTQALLRLHRDAELCARLGTAALRTASAYRTENVAPAYRDWYAEMLGETPYPLPKPRGQHGELS